MISSCQAPTVKMCARAVPIGRETVLAQHRLRGGVLDLGERLRAMQTEVAGHQLDH